MTNIRQVLLDSNEWWKGEFELEYHKRDILEHVSKFISLPQIIAFDARSDGMFPLITNCEDLSLVEILDKYKYQPWLEKRHEQLKTVYKIAPVLLKSVTRIEGLLFVFFLAMLIQALI